MNSPPEGEFVKWWDGDKEDTGGGVSDSGDFNESFHHPDFERYKVDELRINIRASAGGRSYSDDEGDNYNCVSAAEIHSVNVTTRDQFYTKDVDIRSDMPYGFMSDEERKEITVNFQNPANIQNITLIGHIGGGCRSSGWAGIMDITPVKDNGYFHNLERLEGNYSYDDDWMAKDLGRGTYNYRIDVSTGPVKIYKDEVSHCRYKIDHPRGDVDNWTMRRWRGYNAITYMLKDANNTGGHPSYCLEDWSNGKAQTVLEEDKNGSSEPHRQLKEVDIERKRQIAELNDNTSAYFEDTFTLHEHFVEEDSVRYQSKRNRSWKFSPWPAFVDESIIVDTSKDSEFFKDRYYNRTSNTWMKGGRSHIESFEVMKIWPTGNTWLRNNGEFFGGKNNIIESTVNAEDRMNGDQGWITLDSFNLDFRRRERMKISGEYYQGLPSTRSLENYRLVHRSSGEEILRYTDLNEEGSGYVEKSKIIKVPEVQPPGGVYELQMRADPDSSSVLLGVRDFRIEFDEDIGWNETKIFNMDLESGDNKLEFFTARSNVLEYGISWQECHNPLKNPSPSEGYLAKLETRLSVELNCDRNLEVRFYNANTDTLIGKETGMNNGDIARSDLLSLSLGREYRWYAEACDVSENACHRTPVYSFRVGKKPADINIPNFTQKDVVDVTRGMSKNIRDDDASPTGAKNALSKEPKSKGYHNKLEEQSDQLQPGAENRLDSRNITKWRDSRGSEKRADQWAITPNRKWAISNTGTPYPPWGSYYRDADAERPGPDSGSVRKESKVFGNSLAVVASRDVRDDVDGDGSKELVARKESGVWVDPDEWVKYDWYESRYEHPEGLGLFGETQATGQGQRLVGLNMDLTGRDSGFGVDDGSINGDTVALNDERVRKGDIYFRGETS
ncbi:MAG: hypothetical protein ABEJ56_02620 [Candidatus Nanohaloarchaea archaeon]